MRKPMIRILLSVLLVAVVAVGGTLAYLVASDSPLLNTFALMRISTEVEEPSTGTAETKDPKVKNTGTADVYVRAIAYVVMVDKDGNEYVDPVAAAKVSPVYNTAKWGDGGDGYYYYTSKLAPNATTEELFTDVTVASDMSTDQSFRVYVYQESVLAETNTNYTTASEIKGVFANAPQPGANS